MNAPHAPQDTRIALQPLALTQFSRSLYFDRFGRPELEKDERRRFFSDGFGCQKLKNKCDSWNSWLRDAGLPIEPRDILFAQLQSRIMVNMAGGVMENAGLCLDRLGVPYIPGSAVKGCARRMAIQDLLEAREAKEPADKLARLLADVALVFGWGEEDWQSKSELKPVRNESDEQLQKRWEEERSDFAYACGDMLWPQIREGVRTRLCAQLQCKEFPTAFAGNVSFLPAYPHQLPANDLELDVLTCHHRIYYSAEPDRQREPQEWAEWNRHRAAPDTEEPNPVVFPAVTTGIVFQFAVLPLRKARECLSRPAMKLQTIARDWVLRGLESFGLGAKTAAGYGWFKEVLPTRTTTTASPAVSASSTGMPPAVISPAHSALTEHLLITQWRGRTQPANFRAFRPLLAAIQNAEELGRVFNAIMPSNEQQPRTLRNPYWQSFRSHPEGAAILQRLQITLR